MRKLTKLKAEMLRQNITSLKLCHDLSINPNVFSLYLNGWRKMPDNMRKAVAEYVHIEETELSS